MLNSNRRQTGPKLQEWYIRFKWPRYNRGRSRRIHRYHCFDSSLPFSCSQWRAPCGTEGQQSYRVNHSVSGICTPLSTCACWNCNHSLCGLLCLAVCAHIRVAEERLPPCVVGDDASLASRCSSQLGPNWTACFSCLIANRPRWVYYSSLLLLLHSPFLLFLLRPLSTLAN